MAWENVKDYVPSLVASGDLSTKQYLFGVIDSNGQVAANTSAGGIVDGVICNKPDAQGKSCQLAALNGINVAKVYSGAGVTQGARVQSDAAGKAIDTASAKFSAGVALEAASKADVLIPVLLIPYGLEA